MKKSILFSALLAGIVPATFAQTQEELKAIDQLCGCFEVTFNYAETFTNDKSKEYKAKELDKKSVIEYVHPVVKTKDNFVLQHILVVSDKMMIKHWREDWKYQNNVVWDYNGDDVWTKRQVADNDVKGEWTQTVWEVSDAPRYQGSSKWVNTNNEVFWINTVDAPLPRREYTTRRDYNVMNRTNRLIVSDKGYMHEQDNLKVIRKEGQADSVLAYEKGYNKYVRVDDSKCEKAIAFWKGKEVFWADVRNIWEDYFTKYNRIELKNRVDGKLLHEALDEIEKKNLDEKNRKSELEKLFSGFVIAS